MDKKKKEKKKKKSEVLNSLFGTPDKKIDIKRSACSNFVSFSYFLSLSIYPYHYQSKNHSQDYLLL